MPRDEATTRITAGVKTTYVKVLIVRGIVLLGLWLLQQAFL
jgi:hypothetical protein